jgi:MFS family permease
MDRLTRRNAVINIAGEGIWGFMWNLVPAATVLTVLLHQYGAGGTLIGAITAIEAAAMLLPQALGAYVFHRRERRNVRLVLWHQCVMLPFLLAMAGLTFAADRLAPVLYRTLMLLAFAGFSGAIGIVSAAWMDFFGDLFPQRARGTVQGLSMFAAAAAGTGGALCAGRLLAALPAPAGYAWLYLAAWAIGAMAISLWLVVRPPPARQVGAALAPPPLRELAARFAASLADPPFRAFVIARVLAACGFCILPFIAVHYTAQGLGGSRIVSAFAAFTAGTAVGSLALGRLGDRRGHRLGVVAGVGAQSLTLTVLLLVPGLPGCLLAYLGAGFCNACALVSHFNLILESCPHDNRVAHISVANLVIGLPLAVAPLLAGVLAEHAGLTTLFRLSLALSLAALAWTLLRVREPRTLEPRRC